MPQLLAHRMRFTRMEPVMVGSAQQLRADILRQRLMPADSGLHGWTIKQPTMRPEREQTMTGLVAEAKCNPTC